MTLCDNSTSRKLFLFLLLTILMTPSAKADENLLTNPGFENGNTQGWAGWSCTLLVTQEQVHTGNYSVLVSNRTQSWQGPAQSIYGKMESGKKYRISGWIRLQNTEADNISITIKQDDSSGTHYDTVKSSLGFNFQWVLLSGDFTLDVTGNLSALHCYFHGPKPGINFYLDDVEIVALEQPDPNAAGSVDVSTVYQELEGFGASGAWYEGWLTNHPQKNEIYDVLFGQLGLDIYRLRNTYDIDQDNITSSAEIIAAAETSLGYPVKIMISSWSPPAYLKSNGNVAGGTLAWHPDGSYKYDEFAKWWADSLAAYESHGINIDYVNIQNEPDYSAPYDSCKFTPRETSEWPGYNMAFEAVYQELASRMTDMPKLLADDSSGFVISKEFIRELIDPNHAYGYAHHLYEDSRYYANGQYDKPDYLIQGMQDFAVKYGDKPLFQTEYSCLYDMKPFNVAFNTARHIHNSLVHEGICSYLYWSLFWGDDRGFVTLDDPWRDNPGYTINPVYYAFKQYSAFTNPGWHRVEASTDSNDLRISAFKNDDDTELSIVIINISNVDINLTLSLGAFAPDSSAIYRTSETEYAEYSGTFDQSQPLVLGAQSITTISLAGSYTPIVSSNEEGFESGGLNRFDWVSLGDADWTVTSDEYKFGSYSARAGSIGDDESTTLKLILDCISGQISFYYKVSSERYYDYLRFYIDGVLQDEWSGNEGWNQVAF